MKTEAETLAEKVERLEAQAARHLPEMMTAWQVAKRAEDAAWEKGQEVARLTAEVETLRARLAEEEDDGR